jgi:purine-binding chemotaxis protein CheW
MEQQQTQNNSVNEAHLTFSLDKEIFSIPVEYVKEILEIGDVTNVPESPSFMRGILNLRGNILPIVDTRKKLSLAEAEDTKKTRIIVIELNSNGRAIKLGAVVDRAWEVVAFETNEINPAPSEEDYSRADYLSGVVRYNDQFVMIIDVEKLFGKKELQQIENMHPLAEVN